MIALLRKEINQFFSSVIGLLTIVLFLLVNTLFLWIFSGDFNLLDFGYATLDPFFMLSPIIFLIFIPAVCMRLFSEEYQSGTIESLLTKPISFWNVVFSKFLAANVLVLFAIIPTLIYFLSIYYLGETIGNLDIGGIMGSYFGLFMLSSTFIAIGILASSISSNQVVAYLIAIVCNSIIYYGFDILSNISFLQNWDLFISNLGISKHYERMSKGILDSRDIMYFLSACFFFLMLCKTIIQQKRWMGKRTYIPLLYGVIFIILFNTIGSYMHSGLDLTNDKKHTLSKQTKEILSNLDDIIYIKVYLKGEFPSGFKRLAKQSRETLENFKNIAGKRLDFEFINPSESSNEQERNAVYQQLVELGLQPTDLQVKEKTRMSSSIIFPGAIIYYKEKHLPLELLKNQLGVAPQVALNNSIEMLEYELISTISKLIKIRKEKIAFLSGHGELNEVEVADISYSVMQNGFSLSEYYELEHFDITEFEIDSNTNEPNLARQLQKLKSFKAIIIAKPTIAFNNLDKLLIDQYIMAGGNLLWVLDGVSANMDSLRISDGYFIAKKNQLNLDDMLFIYGARINADLIQDKRATEIPIITGYSGNMPQQSFFSWPYYPLLLSDSKNDISRGLDAIKCEFASSVDTIKNKIKKSILLHSSENSRIVPTPQRISLGILKNPPEEEYFNNINIPIAVLLEGKFESVFKNRIKPRTNEFDFRETGESAKMIVISDGDMIRNSSSEKTGNIYPLGYDKFGEFIYPGNKTFLMNAMHYLCDNKQDLLLTPLKTKELRLRLLNKEKLQNNRLIIQLVNLLFPIIIIIILGMLFTYNKRRKYA